jgi:hypothetical protein
MDKGYGTTIKSKYPQKVVAATSHQHYKQRKSCFVLNTNEDIFVHVVRSEGRSVS